MSKKKLKISHTLKFFVSFESPMSPRTRDIFLSRGQIPRSLHFASNVESLIVLCEMDDANSPTIQIRLQAQDLAGQLLWLRYLDRWTSLSLRFTLTSYPHVPWCCARRDLETAQAAVSSSSSLTHFPQPPTSHSSELILLDLQQRVTEVARNMLTSAVYISGNQIIKSSQSKPSR